MTVRWKHGVDTDMDTAALLCTPPRPMDPYRTDDPVVNGLFELVGEDTEVLDVGGGAGRLALPLATRARHVTVVDPSEDSVELLKTRMAESGLTNVTVINEPWQDVDVPPADVVLCSLVLHHQLEAASFVERLQEHARDRVVVVEMMQTPGAVYRPFQERVYGEAIAPLPGIPMLLAPALGDGDISRCLHAQSCDPHTGSGPRLGAGLHAPPPVRGGRLRGGRATAGRDGRSAGRHPRRDYRPGRAATSLGDSHLAAWRGRRTVVQSVTLTSHQPFDLVRELVQNWAGHHTRSTDCQSRIT